MTNRRELADRLEAAECGSRELDRQIGELFDAPMGSSGDAVGLGYAKFTTSLDAALALAERVLPGCRWRLNTDESQDGFWAEIKNAPPHTTSERYRSVENAKTPALALCAAILRARLDEEGKGGAQ